MEKQIKIVPPEGYEIDKENSTLECIKFKPIQNKRWRYNENAITDCFYLRGGEVQPNLRGYNIPLNYDAFATEKEAKSALAMARISQIMANDERFCGVVTDEEWKNNMIEKYVIKREKNYITTCNHSVLYHYLAFHKKEQRDLFIKENEDLVRDFLMID